MDRRKRKTRDAIFKAFTELLAQKDFNSITVGEIIERADIGRATFYAHFETKDYLIKELCEELFCHLFDVAKGGNEHHHIFSCDANDSLFLHLFKHIAKNDNQLFLRYFKSQLLTLVDSNLKTLKKEKYDELPHDFLVNHIASTFVETVKWWADDKCRLSPEQITNCFLSVI